MRWIFLLLTYSLHAAYVGNPAGPGIMNNGFFTSTNPFFKCTTGYYGDYISDMRFVPAKSSTNRATDHTFKQFGLHSQMATASLILLERIEFFGAAGGSKEHTHFSQTPSMTELSTELLDFHSTYTFSWCAGTRVILLQWWQTYFSMDFTYFQVPSSHESYFKFLNQLHLPLETEKQTFSIDEWQVSAGLSTRIYFLTPYGGVTYMKAKLNIEGGDEVPPLYYENQERIGYFYGLTLSLTGKFHVNFERRVRDEFAYTISTIAVF